MTFLYNKHLIAFDANYGNYMNQSRFGQMHSWKCMQLCGKRSFRSHLNQWIPPNELFKRTFLANRVCDLVKVEVI